MTIPNLSPIADLYSVSLQKHGSTPQGVGWRDHDTQMLRFRKLTGIVDSDPRFTVNELGCGYGALFEYFEGIAAPLEKFRGHDISAPMLDEARKRIGRSEIVEFSDSPLLDQQADYSFASGIFNVRLEYEETAWLRYIDEIVTNLNDYSKRGFAFNMLSTYVDFRETHLNYGDPLRFFDLCKRKFGRFVTLLHDYPLYEWTITVKKQ